MLSTATRQHSPRTSADYRRVEAMILANRQQWISDLRAGRRELSARLEAQGYRVLTGHRRKQMLSARHFRQSDVVLYARLKRTTAILQKMARFRESFDQILDVWGYRLVVANTRELDRVVALLSNFWQTPKKADLLLRNGDLQFDWLRDYRLQEHAGLSESSSPRYDEAVHLNRKAPFGICEIQVITGNLYRRAYGSNNRRHEAHAAFTRRKRARKSTAS